MELTGRAFQESPFHLIVEIEIRLLKRTRARVQVTLPEGMTERHTQERSTECPDPPCHEVMHFEFALRPEARVQIVHISVLARADNGETSTLNLAVSIRDPIPG